MSWYLHMFKSHEVVRQRNRREIRRLQRDRHGPRFVESYQLAELDKEKRMIEKELERIRQGIHKQPKLGENEVVSGSTRNSHVLSVVSPRQQNIHNATASRSTDPEYSEDENHLYQAIMYLQNNPSALVPILSAHAHSDAYLETLERIVPRLAVHEPHQPFVPNYLKPNAQVSRAEKSELLNKYTALLHSQSPILRRSSPLLERKRYSPTPQRRDSPLLVKSAKSSQRHNGDSRDSPLLENSVKANGTNATDSSSVDKLGDETLQHEMGSTGSHLEDTSEKSKSLQDMRTLDSASSKQESTIPSPRKTAPTSRQALDLAKLAADGMTSARENVNQRLTSRSGDDLQSMQRKMSTGDAPRDDVVRPVVEEKSRSKPVAKTASLFPQYDPELYNPDGSLRKVHQLPTSDQLWQEAEKARYLRTRDLPERDRELAIHEIFEKK